MEHEFREQNEKTDLDFKLGLDKYLCECLSGIEICETSRRGGKKKDKRTPYRKMVDEESVRRYVDGHSFDGCSLFVKTLKEFMEAKSLTVPEVCEGSRLSRQDLSRILNGKTKTVRKHTVYSLAIGLMLTTEETTVLLGSAGYIRDPTDRGELIINYFIDHGYYNVIRLNIMLEEYHEKLLADNYDGGSENV